MTTQNPYRARATRVDRYQRKHEREQLDSYVAALQFDPVKTPEEIILEQEAYTKLIQRIDALPPRIGLCIKLRQGIGCEPHTLEQVGDRYGVSRGRVQQIEAKGYRILKHRIWLEETPQRWRQEQENLKKAERERELKAAINALWPSELERRAQQERKRLALQACRQAVERQLQKYVDKRNTWLGKIDRDWLFVATEGVS